MTARPLTSAEPDWIERPCEEQIRALSQCCCQADGCRNLDDTLLLAYLEGQGEGAWTADGPCFLSLCTDGQLGQIQLLVAPQARGQGLGSRLLELGIQRLQSQGCSRVQLWAYGDKPRTTAWLERKGFQSRRVLYELRRSDSPPSPPQWPPGWSVQDFRPDADLTAWHELHHRLQSDPARAWSLATLRRNLNAVGQERFWLLWRGEQLHGYVWLKAGSPEEVFMFAVAPEARGQGLGQRLLRWALSQGDGSAFAYCDDRHLAALALYGALGFGERGRDRCLSLTL